MFLTSMTACENRTNFLPCIYFVQFDWLISDQLRYSLNIYQFDCYVVHFPIENNSNKSTCEFHFLFYFPFWHLENNEINEKNFEKGHSIVGISWEIWCSNRKDREIWWKTWRLQGKLGELAGMIRQSAPVWCYLQSVTLKCFFSTVRITVSSHNFKLQNYSGKYLLNLNNYKL